MLTTPSRRRLALALALVMLIPVLPMAVSYGQALATPGEATWTSKTVDWARDHGAGPVINIIENWYYTTHPPADAPPPGSALPAGPGSRQSTVDTAGPDPLPKPPSGRTPLRGEGQWYAKRTDPAEHRPLLYVGYLRPDPSHASVIAGVAWIRRSAVTAHLVAGTTQPGGSGWDGNAAVPAADVPSLVATFNSGWRMKDIVGGFLQNGHAAPRMVAGQATAAIDDQGRIDVGQWGRDIRPGPHLAAARQNLELIVDNGRVAPELTQNYQEQWGSPKNQYQYTDRSALGVDRQGNLIYVAGSGLTLETLAIALADANAVRGMELDIHKGYTFFASWAPRPTGQPVPTKLLPTMRRSANRYLQPDQRDFFYLTLRSTPTHNRRAGS
jgi:hypothetical protein